MIRIGVSIVNDDVGLFCVLQFFDLAATVRAEHSGNVDLFTAVLAELEVLRCGIGGICIHDGSPSLVYIYLAWRYWKNRKYPAYDYTSILPVCQRK